MRVGVTIREIQHHLAATLGTELSHETISNITEAVMDEVTQWQDRPLEAFYPVIFLDALVVKVRDQNRVVNRHAHIVVGVDTEGVKHVLGIWVQAAEGAKFWASVCAQLANRGLKDVLIVCCDGLTGFPEAIEATWPGSLVQTCVVHLIRASMRYVAYADRKAVAAALRPVYTAVDADAALAALVAFADSALGKKYPAAVATWENAWDRFIPFLDFGPATRKVIYTTNSIESLNYQLRKIIKNRGQSPQRCRGGQTVVAGDPQVLRTRGPVNEPNRPANPELNARPPGNWLRVLPSRAGPEPSTNSPSATPNDSPKPTKPNHLHKQLDKLCARPHLSG